MELTTNQRNMLIKGYKSEIEVLQNTLDRLIGQMNDLSISYETRPNEIDVYRTNIESCTPEYRKTMYIKVPYIRSAIINHISDYIDELTAKKYELENELSILTYSKEPKQPH